MPTFRHPYNKCVTKNDPMSPLGHLAPMFRLGVPNISTRYIVMSALRFQGQLGTGSDKTATLRLRKFWLALVGPRQIVLQTIAEIDETKTPFRSKYEATVGRVNSRAGNLFSLTRWNSLKTAIRATTGRKPLTITVSRRFGSPLPKPSNRMPFL